MRASFWRRELRASRLLGPAYVSLILRWFTWGLALVLSLPGLSQPYNTTWAPLALLITGGWLLIMSAYLPVVRAALPRGLRHRGSMRAFERGALVCVLDVLIAGLAIVVTGGWGSPFYTYGLASVVMPALMFGYRAAWLAGVSFAALFLLAVIAVPEGIERVLAPGNGAGLLGFVLVPTPLGLFAAYLGDLMRQLEAERDRGQRALAEAEILQAVMASGLRHVAAPDQFVAETVARLRGSGRLRGFAIAYRQPPAADDGPTDRSAGFGPIDALMAAYWRGEPVQPTSLMLPLPLAQGQRQLGLLIAVAPFVELRRPFLTALAGQVAVALTNAQLAAEAEALAARAERTRLAREIHDGIAQSMYMLTLNLEAAAELVDRDPEWLRARLQTLIELARQTLWETRHYVHDLKPLLADERGLRPAIETLTREFGAISGLPVALAITGDEPPLLPVTRQALYRIVQEALANVFKHAGAAHVTVELGFAADGVRLSIADDGRGLTPVNGTAGERGFGLTTMRARAEELGGRFEVTSTPGTGTRLTVHVPATSHHVARRTVPARPEEAARS
ncbi:MAG: sensor histidine kinase [Chloroflexi bacterium]|nr:sensor histidine kinase [Chloroflexota bacterium]